MSIAKRIVKNTAWLYGAEIVGKILQFILIMAIARHYGASTFGQYSFAMTFTLIFSMFVDLGMNSLLIREVAKNKKRAPKYLSNLLFIKFILGILCFIVIFIVINLAEYPMEIRFLVYSFGIYNIFFQILELLKSFFKAYEFMHLDSVIKVSEKIMTTGAALILVALGYSILTVSYAFIVSAFLAILFSLLLIAKKISRFVADIDREFIMKFLKMSVPFAAGLILYTVYFRADVLLINFLKGSVSTGVYSSAFQFVELILFIPLFVSIAVFPLLSHAYSHSRERFWKMYNKLMKALCIAGVPIVVGTLILGDRFILLFFGSEYSDAGRVLKILVVFTFLNFFNQFHNTVMVSMNWEKKLITLMGVVFILNLCLNYFFIPSFSIFGAAYVKVFSEIAYFVGALIIIHPKIDIAALLVLLKTFFVGAVLFVIVMYAAHLNLFFLIFIAALSYALLVLLFKIFSDEDFSLMSEIVRR